MKHKRKKYFKKICSFPSLKYRVRIGLSPQRSVYGPGCIFIWIIMKRFSSVDLNLKQLNFSLFLKESILLKIWWIVMWHHLWSQKHACTPVFNITGFDFIVNFQLLNQWWEDGNLWVGLRTTANRLTVVTFFRYNTLRQIPKWQWKQLNVRKHLKHNRIERKDVFLAFALNKSIDICLPIK